MIVKSQNGCSLVECRNFVINDKFEIIGIINEKLTYLLGEYETLNKAKEIISFLAEELIKGSAYYAFPPKGKHYNLAKYFNLNEVRFLHQVGIDNLEDAKETYIQKNEELKKNLLSVRNCGHKTVEHILSVLENV